MGLPDFSFENVQRDLDRIHQRDDLQRKKDIAANYYDYCFDRSGVETMFCEQIWDETEFQDLWIAFMSNAPDSELNLRKFYEEWAWKYAEKNT